MTPSEVAVELQTRAKTVVANAYDVWPDQFSLPAAIVRLPSAQYDPVLGDACTIHAEVELLVESAARGISMGYRKLDAYLAPSGELSVVQALQGGPFSVTGWKDRGVREIGTNQYVGVTLTVEVLA